MRTIMHGCWRRVTLLVVILVLSLFALNGVHADTVHLVILHSNDSHGHLFSPEGGDTMSDTGGIARTATVIRQSKEANPGHVLVVHAGDVLSRGDALTIATQGKLDFCIMKRIGYEVFVPGNGEFYSGLDTILACQRASHLPMIHANVALKATGTRPFPPYLIRTIAGVRVGILGLGFIRMEHPASESLTYLDPIEEARRLVPILREQSDVVMVLSHLGFNTDKELAATVPGIDLIVGGHSHTVLNTPVQIPKPNGQGTVAIAQAGDYGRYIGCLDLDIERAVGTAPHVTITGKLITLDNTVSPEASIVKLLDRKITQLHKVVCQSPVDLPNPKTGESPMARWMVEQVRRTAGADVAIMRRDKDRKPITKGPITRAEVYRMYPYRDRVCLIEMTPDQVGTIMANEKNLVSTTLPEGYTTYRVAVDQYTRSITAAIKTLPFKTTRYRVDEILFDALRHGHFETESSAVHRSPRLAPAMENR